MATINTLADLRAEQQNLQARKIFLESEIKRDFEEIKLELEPLKLFTRGAKTLLTSHDNGLLGNAFGYLADFVARKVVFRNAGLITKLVVPFLVKNTTSNLVEENKFKIVNVLGNLLAKVIKKKAPENDQEQEHEYISYKN